MTPRDEPLARLAALMAAPGDDFDLAEAALLVAARAEPQLSVGRELARLDDLADDARPWVDSATPWPDGLSRFLFAVRDEDALRSSRHSFQPANHFFPISMG